MMRKQHQLRNTALQAGLEPEPEIVILEEGAGQDPESFIYNMPPQSHLNHD